MDALAENAELEALLVNLASEYETLLALSHAQERVFDEEPARLKDVIAEKQRVIARVARLSGRLGPYMRDWDATVAAMPEDAREEAEALRERCESLLAELRASEAEVARKLSAARARTAAEIRQVKEANRAMRGYGRARRAGMLVDRED